MEKIEFGLKIRNVHNRIRRLIDYINGCGDDKQISSINWRILCFLHHHSNNEIYQKDIEEEFKITRSTSSRILSLMEQKHLVERKSVTGDKRLKSITITKDGQDAFNHIRNNIDFVENGLINNFSKQEQLDLFDLLDRIEKNLDKMEEDKYDK